MTRFFKFVLAGLVSANSCQVVRASKRYASDTANASLVVRREDHTEGAGRGAGREHPAPFYFSRQTSLLGPAANARGGRANRIISASAFFILAGWFWLEFFLEASR